MRKHIMPVVIAIIYEGDRFFLTERKNTDEEDAIFGKRPLWHFPGGGLEFGEELDRALTREIKEETNLTILVQKQIPRIFTVLRDHWHGLLIPHLCTVVGDAKVTLNFESVGYGWFTYDEVQKLHKLPLVSEMLDEAVQLLKKG